MTDRHSCDVCGSSNSIPIDSLSSYIDGREIDVCKKCGFVFVSSRRNYKEIAESWSDRIFANGQNKSTTGEVYTAVRPAIRARLIQILETIDQEIGVEGASICDIGAGEGVFLNYASTLKNTGEIFGVEPSKVNCELLTELGIPNFSGTIEEFISASGEELPQFDIVVIQWTLECCASPREMLQSVWKLLRPGGHVVIGTGSRILVPFKKPLQFYVGPGEQDTHAFRFSAKSLRNMLRLTGFLPTFTNRYIDNDVLCVIAEKKSSPSLPDLEIDDYREVLSFFDRWHLDSKKYYSNWIDT